MLYVYSYLMCSPPGHSDDSEGETLNHPDRTLLPCTWTTIQHQQTISTTRGRDYSKGTHTNTIKDRHQ